VHGISGGHNRRSKIKYLYFVKVYIAGTTMFLDLELLHLGCVRQSNVVAGVKVA
jgi:hypothetical protein